MLGITYVDPKKLERIIEVFKSRNLEPTECNVAKSELCTSEVVDAHKA